MTRRCGFLAVSAALAWAGTPPAGAQAIAPEFRVNSYTTERQWFPSVAAAADGRFVVVWYSLGQDGSGYGVFGQRYDANGVPAGAEFRLNSYTTESQGSPSVAAAADGRFVVVWYSYGQDGSGYGVFGQRYDSNGVPAGAEFRVNSHTTESQRSPSVAAATDGRFVVTWEGNLQDGSGAGVFGQRYDSNGARVGAEFRVNSYTTGFQGSPSVAAAADGRFVVTWYSDLQDGSFSGVFGQRYDSNGVPAGPEFRVNSYTTYDQLPPRRSVAAAADGRFVVIWSGAGQGGDSGVFGQRYSSNGVAVGAEFRANSSAGLRDRPSLAVAADGRFAVTWRSYAQDGSGFGVFGQRYSSNGVPVGAEFRVNSYTTGSQEYPSVAAAADGHFVVTWQSYAQDGSGFGVFGLLDAIFAGGFDCPNGTFVFPMTSTEGSTFTGAAWPGGSETQSGPAGCSVTAQRPTGNVSIVGTLGDRWLVTGRTGYSNCVGVGGEDGDGVATPDCSQLTLSIGSVQAGRPSCSNSLCSFCTGRATDTFTVQCVQ